jgi:hypothetical protein
MIELNITENLFLTLSIGVITILLGCIILSDVQRWLFGESQKILLGITILLAGLSTIITWPICLYHRPLMGYRITETKYIWDYYGFPFPIHKSNEYFPELTMSITRHPFFIGLLGNFLFYGIFILITYKILTKLVHQIENRSADFSK